VVFTLFKGKKIAAFFSEFQIHLMQSRVGVRFLLKAAVFGVGFKILL
jgi:hypothetical protein